ncbi:MAG TPA: regulatory protein RecX [Flammeovirgaceae bacterium]|nr:regulatory protein RecX [Flammeovirgaceae bacterium]
MAAASPGKGLPDDPDKIKARIMRYCAYRERAHSEVRQKLYEYGLRSEAVEELMAWLITENFLNEERYAITYAGSKFRQKQWGRIKIQQQLQQKGVSDYCINKALQEIDEDEYLATINRLIEKKMAIKADNIYEKRHKIARFLIGKGFEPEKVWQQIRTVLP